MNSGRKQLSLELVTPENEVFNGPILFGVFPGSEGEVGILPGHAPMLTSLRAGAIRLRTPEGPRFLAVSGGFMDVGTKGISVLAETAEPAENIDITRAERSRQLALEQIERELGGDEYTQAVARLARATARLKAAESAGRLNH